MLSQMSSLRPYLVCFYPRSLGDLVESPLLPALGQKAMLLGNTLRSQCCICASHCGHLVRLHPMDVSVCVC